MRSHIAYLKSDYGFAGLAADCPPSTSLLPLTLRGAPAVRSRSEHNHAEVSVVDVEAPARIPRTSCASAAASAREIDCTSRVPDDSRHGFA